MTSIAQQELQRLKVFPANKDWDDSPNEWVRSIATRNLSQLGVEVVHAILGGQIHTEIDLGYKISRGHDRIVVRTATLYRIRSHASFSWKNISKSKAFSHLALLAIYHADARLFLIPHESIETLPVSSDRTDDSLQISTTHGYDLPSVFTMWEIRAAA